MRERERGSMNHLCPCWPAACFPTGTSILTPIWPQKLQGVRTQQQQRTMVVERLPASLEGVPHRLPRPLCPPSPLARRRSSACGRGAPAETPRMMQCSPASPCILSRLASPCILSRADSRIVTQSSIPGRVASPRAPPTKSPGLPGPRTSKLGARGPSADAPARSGSRPVSWSHTWKRQPTRSSEPGLLTRGWLPETGGSKSRLLSLHSALWDFEGAGAIKGSINRKPAPSHGASRGRPTRAACCGRPPGRKRSGGPGTRWTPTISRASWRWARRSARSCFAQSPAGGASAERVRLQLSDRGPPGHRATVCSACRSSNPIWRERHVTSHRESEASLCCHTLPVQPIM